MATSMLDAELASCRPNDRAKADALARRWLRNLTLPAQRAPHGP